MKLCNAFNHDDTQMQNEKELGWLFKPFQTMLSTENSLGYIRHFYSVKMPCGSDRLAANGASSPAINGVS